MQLRQIIFSTCTSRDINGAIPSSHELLGYSDGVDGAVRESIFNWCPHQSEITFGRNESTDFFQVQPGLFALARSFKADLNADIGQRKIVSHFVLLESNQLAGYRNNVIALARTIASFGGLRLQTRVPPNLPLLEVPGQTLRPLTEQGCQKFACLASTVDGAIKIHGQVALLGLNDPFEFLCGFYASLPLDDRLEISFSSGLNVNENRPFHLHFFPSDDVHTRQALAEQQIRTIDANKLNQASLLPTG